MRFLSLLFSLVILALIVLVVFLYFGLDDYLSSYLTSRLGTKTEIERVKLGTHTVKLEKVKIASPGRLPHAFEAQEVLLDAPLSRYWGETIHLDSFLIENPIFSIELFNSSGSSNNWVPILKNFPQSEGGGRRFVIDRLVLSNVQFQVIKSNGKFIHLPTIPYLEFQDIGKKRGLTTGEIGRVIFQTILSVVTKESGLSKILNNVKAESILQEIKVEGMSETLERVRRRAGHILQSIIGD